jgi:hypothetical protein
LLLLLLNSVIYSLKKKLISHSNSIIVKWIIINRNLYILL